MNPPLKMMIARNPGGGAMRVAICDDETTQIKLMRLFITKWSAGRSVDVQVYGYTSAEEYLMHAEESSFDLLFLDIQMGQISGVDLAMSLRRHNEDLSIVFVTGLREHVFAGFEVQALHYLVKPIKEEDIHCCLDRALERSHNAKEHSLVFSFEGETRPLPLAQLVYAEAEGHYLRLVTSAHQGEDQLRIKMALADLEQELKDAGFYRCHRSYLVNLRYVIRIAQNDIVLDNQATIPVSRQNRDGLLQAFITYYKGMI